MGSRSMQLPKVARFDSSREPSTLEERAEHMANIITEGLNQVILRLPSFTSLNYCTHNIYELLLWETTKKNGDVQHIETIFIKLKNQSTLVGNTIMTIQGIIHLIIHELDNACYPTEILPIFEPALKCLAIELKKCIEYLELLCQITILSVKNLFQSKNYENWEVIAGEIRSATEKTVESLLEACVIISSHASKLHRYPGRYGVNKTDLQISQTSYAFLLEFPEYRKPFVLQPALRKHIVKCHIIRDTEGVDDQGETVSLYLERSNQSELLLLVARKVPRLFSIQYEIFTTCIDAINYNYGGENSFAILQGSFWGTKFSLNCTRKPNSYSPELLEVDELLDISYNARLPSLSNKTDHTFTIVIPAVENHLRIPFQKETPNDSLQQRWDGLSGSEQLDSYSNIFSVPTDLSNIVDREGLSCIPKPENFILYENEELDEDKEDSLSDSTDEQDVVIQFACISPNSYILDYSYPLCAIQAFGIALSAITRKWGCL